MKRFFYLALLPRIGLLTLFFSMIYAQTSASTVSPYDDDGTPPPLVPFSHEYQNRVSSLNRAIQPLLRPDDIAAADSSSSPLLYSVDDDVSPSHYSDNDDSTLFEGFAGLDENSFESFEYAAFDEETFAPPSPFDGSLWSGDNGDVEIRSGGYVDVDVNSVNAPQTNYEVLPVSWPEGFKYTSSVESGNDTIVEPSQRQQRSHSGDVAAITPLEPNTTEAATALPPSPSSSPQLSGRRAGVSFKAPPPSLESARVSYIDQHTTSPSAGDSSKASPSVLEAAVKLPVERHREENLLAQETGGVLGSTRASEGERPILVNFNNVNIVEFIRFISRLTGKNFIFDEEELQFNVTIVSEEPITVDRLLLMLLQELRIHEFSMIEDDDNYVIYNNQAVTGASKVRAPNLPVTPPLDNQLVTRLFPLNTLDATVVQSVIRSFVSARGNVEALKDTNQLIVTDFTDNVNKIALILQSMDAPNSGLTIGQYVVRNTPIESLIETIQQIMLPIAQGQPITFIPQSASNSIFIITTPFLMERVIPILQRLDQNTGVTGVFDFRDVQFESYAKFMQDQRRAAEEAARNALGLPSLIEEELAPGAISPTLLGGQLLESPFGPGVVPDAVYGRWRLNDRGDWLFEPNLPESFLGSKAKPVTPSTPIDQIVPPSGYWTSDSQGNWIFKPGPRPLEGPESRPEIGPDGLPLQPRGRWVLNPQGIWVFELEAGQSISTRRRTRLSNINPNLPVGYVERSKFYIHKLQFRRGDTIEDALRRVALSLADTLAVNATMIATLNSVQWLEEANSIVVTGPPEYLARIREMILEMDRPLRQVFIEMLILETTLIDTLNYGVTWSSRFGGGNVAGAQSFIAGASGIAGALDTAGITFGAEGAEAMIPSAATLARSAGYNLGIIGQNIVCTSMGLEFSSLGALVQALHERNMGNVIMNPKILTEDGVPAEIFVGINTRYRTQSVANDLGSVITSNFEFRDIGTRLVVTPTLGDSDIITLKIEEEVTRALPSGTSTGGGGGGGGGGLLTDQEAGPTTSKNSTKTKVHIPDGFFLIISGMMQDDDNLIRDNLPCLGGVPILGALFSSRRSTTTKRNLMVFIRPKLIDTEDEMINLTKHQQDVWKVKRKVLPSWKFEVENALDYLNIRDRFDCGSHDDWEYEDFYLLP